MNSGGANASENHAWKISSPTGVSDLARFLAVHPDAKFRNGAEAVRLAEHAAELLKGQDAQTLDTLAAAYAEAGRFAEATETAKKAISLATATGQKPLAIEIQKRSELYQSGRSFHE